MNQWLLSLRHGLRVFKNNLIYQYFKFRINRTQNTYKIVLKKAPYKVIFLLGHMRSGSSLLTNILIANPSIKGYGETHIQYQSEADLKHLMFKIYFHIQEFKSFQDLTKLRMNHTYLLDKLLHDHKLLNEHFLKLDNFYFIFLIREPKRSLLSMLDHKPNWTEKEAVQYYNQRLSTLSRYAQIINSKNRSFFLTYDQLINQTDAVLSALQDFLRTEQKFAGNYQVTNITGRRHLGDFKEKIRSGKIIRKPREIDISICSDLVEKEIEHYNNCYSQLSQFCKTIGDLTSVN